MSNKFYSNIKLLRKRRGRTQDDVAFTLGMKRSTLGGYENGVAQPGMEALVAFSDYFKVSVDTLIKVDLSQLTESELSQLERGYDVFVKGSNLRVLATTVDNENNENIELVDEKAKSGYRTGFADPEFIKVLPAFQMPFLSKQKKYRTFQVSGDSMHPIPDGSWVTGEFVQNWKLIRDRYAYIIHTLDDGVVFKVVENLLESEGKLRLYSLNPIYEPYDVDVKDIREVWKFVNYISNEVPEPEDQNKQLINSVKALQKEVKTIKKEIKLSKKK